MRCLTKKKLALSLIFAKRRFYTERDLGNERRHVLSELEEIRCTSCSPSGTRSRSENAALPNRANTNPFCSTPWAFTCLRKETKSRFSENFESPSLLGKNFCHLLSNLGQPLERHGEPTHPPLERRARLIRGHVPRVSVCHHRDIEPLGTVFIYVLTPAHSCQEVLPRRPRGDGNPPAKHGMPNLPDEWDFSSQLRCQIGSPIRLAIKNEYLILVN